MDQQQTDKQFMIKAMRLADTAARNDEVPVGALLVQDTVIIGEGSNSPIKKHDPTAHAEINALRSGGLKLQNYRLPGSTLYVTLEPCIMCMGAIIHARIQRLVFGAYDPKTGAALSCYNIGSDNILNHQLEITGGICEQECASLLKNFFKKKRQKSS
jgi:tRNA(adenine34) deaminase